MNNTKAMNIMEDYLPLVWNSMNYRLDILDVILCETEWTSRMIDFVDKHEDNDNGDVSWIAQTIMHDIGGLMKNDEHFLPRI
tara:strand:- start:2796 stop:3041 length:246 start_codon:yes stop_codon:yes gene_type:complete